MNKNNKLITGALIVSFGGLIAATVQAIKIAKAKNNEEVIEEMEEVVYELEQSDQEGN